MQKITSEECEHCELAWNVSFGLGCLIGSEL